ncbi:alkaline phosphatase, tissue-nonspecific isozyme isoform X2 [Drosophila innubila]|uniref:alkaline phosphatase, tissue-nonspecific isozyme isoform X2 n=1 Tax=Drosophila innubila TaxID=198719 RepID=UPI00148B923D|nr:alkaline phosphatase, tissue-nonspecific isozyme isoform X2 [Drosophila innubila]
MATSQRWKQICFQLRLKSTQLFIVAGSVLLAVLISLICIGITIRYEVEYEVVNLSDVDYWKDQVSPEQKFWYDKGIQELQQAMRIYSKQSKPKNVLILLVNGIDGRALAAARFPGENSTKEHAHFVWDQFPHLARIKNSCSYNSPCDMSSVSRALWSGVPLKAGIRNSQIMSRNCSRLDQFHSILRQAQLAGLRTGFVTNQRITGATGAALYANVAETSWECDGLMPLGSIEAGCEDVALQLISGETGQALNVVMGGGRQLLSAKVPIYTWDPLDELLCRARNGRNLLRDWRNLKLKLRPRKRFEVVQHEKELSSINATNLDYLMGVLANGDLTANSQAPSLKLMLNKTLEVLRRSTVRHLLIWEHFVRPEMNATRELRLLNETLSTLLGQKNTLTLVLLTNGNYLSPSRDVSGETDLTSTLDETFNQSELQLQLILQQMSSESLLFAQGPKSLLFYGVHEETYLAQALSYALGLNAFGNQL